jgi:RimJ/RimL family protein N-acetyltransferase
MIALSPTPVLETERLVLRAPAARDWPAWRDFIQSERGVWMRADPRINEETAWRAWAGVIGHWVMRGWGSFVFTTHDSDRALGMTGPWAPAGWPEFEIGWSVWAPGDEGRGYVAEAARCAIDHAFRRLGWHTAVSYIAHENTRSIALAKRLGARRDDSAATPRNDTGCAAYRHPHPDEAAA